MYSWLRSDFIILPKSGLNPCQNPDDHLECKAHINIMVDV